MQETVPRDPDRDAVLSIGAGPTQVPLIRAALAAGFRVWAIDRDPSPAAAPLLDAHLPVGTHDPAAALDAIRGHGLACRTRAVIQRTSGPALATAAALAGALHVPGPPVAFCAAAVRKSTLREQAAGLNLPCPAGRLVDPAATDATADRAWLRAQGRPLIAKPDMPLRGKAAVIRLPGAGGRDLVADDGLRRAAAASANGLVEVQDCLPGTDIGLMLLLSDGRPMLSLAFDEIVAQQADGTVRGLGLAAPAAATDAARLTDLALPLARALEMDRGFAFFSFRVDSAGRAHLYEVNPGLCGDGIADRLLPATFPGFDPFAAEIAAWTGSAVLPGGHPVGPHPATLLDGRLLRGNATHNAAAIAAAARDGGGAWTAAA